MVYLSCTIDSHSHAPDHQHIDDRTSRRGIDTLRVQFVPYEPGDVFALAYMASFTEADGTTVVGFRPGYVVHSLSPAGLVNMWVRAQPPGAPEFYFMPKFEWRADERYVVDLASETFVTFSIEAAK